MTPTTPSRIVSFLEASQIVREHRDLLARQGVRSQLILPLLQSLGRTLAAPVHADRDQPPFHRSTRDGFACRAAELNAGHRLAIIGQLRAGERWPRESPAEPRTAKEIGAREAVEIMTGAPVPAGADCVVMLEHVEREEGTVRLREPDPDGRALAPGSNIVAAGAEARAGERILAPGVRMGAAQIAAAAALGATQVTVFDRPRVAILVTGDELVESAQQPLLHQVRNSNGPLLAAQVLAAGGEPVELGIAGDDAEELEAMIQPAFEPAFEADLLLLSGGVSAGKYDLVEQVLLSMGAEFFFTGALIQPGKPVVFGRRRGKSAPGGRAGYFFGLPGNPVSTMITFSLFVEPLLAAFGGAASSRFVQARLRREVRGKKAGFTRFLPAFLDAHPEQAPLEPAVELVPWRGSGDIFAVSRANCFLVVPSDRVSLSAGETVTVLL